MGESNKLVFWDLFAGIGGFHIAFSEALKKVNSNIKPVCELVSEIDKQAIDVYSNNFLKKKKVPIMGIDEIDPINEKSNPDIIFGGFPCQPFSKAGIKMGFKDSRGQMINKIADLLSIKKPKFCVLENVSHITRHNNGKTWKAVIKLIKDCGYTTSSTPLILSPKEFGIPQDRKRVFILLVRNDLLKDKEDFINYINSLKETIPKGNSRKYTEELTKEEFEEYKLIDRDSIPIKAWDELVGDLSSCNERIPFLCVDWFINGIVNEKYIPSWKQKAFNKCQVFYEKNKKTIDIWVKKHEPQKSWSTYQQKLEWNAGKVSSLKESVIQFRQSGVRCRKIDTYPTLVAAGQVPVIYDRNFKDWRRFTRRECANLQSFPRKFQLSESVRSSYKQFGNSINIKVATFAIEALLNYAKRNSLI